MNLDNMVNMQNGDLKMTAQRFQKLKNYMKAAEKDPEPAHNEHLSFAIDSMLNRWNVPAGDKRIELKKVVAKIHAKRIVTPESRILYRVLNENIDNISVAIT